MTGSALVGLSSGAPNYGFGGGIRLQFWFATGHNKPAASVDDEVGIQQWDDISRVIAMIEWKEMGSRHDAKWILEEGI